MGAEYDYIRGNTVVKPSREYQVGEKKKKRRKPEKSKNKQGQNISQVRKSILQITSIMTALGICTIVRYGTIYKMQSELSQLKDEIKVSSDVGESLKVDLLKYSSLESIKSKAEKKLGMVTPDKSSTITVDMNKDFFEKQEN